MNCTRKTPGKIPTSDKNLSCKIWENSLRNMRKIFRSMRLRTTSQRIKALRIKSWVLSRRQRRNRDRSKKLMGSSWARCPLKSQPRKRRALPTPNLLNPSLKSGRTLWTSMASAKISQASSSFIKRTLITTLSSSAMVWQTASWSAPASSSWTLSISESRCSVKTETTNQMQM